MASLKEAPEAPAPAILIDLALDKISPWKDNPRKSPGEEEIAELAASLKDVGPIQPIVVRPVDSKITFGVTIAEELEYRGRDYVIVCGERRFLAANVAGLKTLPAIVRDMTREQALKIAIIENLQREDVNAIDEARSLDMLLKETDLTQEAVGEKIGKSQAYIANRVRLLELPAAAVEAIAAGILSASHGKVLLGLKKWPTVMAALTEKIAAEPVSVAKLEEILEDAWNLRYHLPETAYRHPLDDETCEKCKDLFDEELCLNPGCHDGKAQKLSAAQRKEEKKYIEDLKAQGKDVKDIPDLRNLSYGAYERFYDGADVDTAACAECEDLRPARGYSGAIDATVCLKPACYRKKQGAIRRAETKIQKEARAQLVDKAAEAAGGFDQLPDFVLRSLLIGRIPKYAGSWDMDRMKEFAAAFDIELDLKNAEGTAGDQIRARINLVDMKMVAKMLVFWWILDQEKTSNFAGDTHEIEAAHKADELLGRAPREFRN